METASVALVLFVGLIKLLATFSLIVSLRKWRMHRGFPYKPQALAAECMFYVIAAHITFRLLCLFWQPVFGPLLLFIDLASTPFMVMLAYQMKKAVDAADKQP